MASPVNKQLDHEEAKYGIRFAWYRYETEQDKELKKDRFAEPPVQPFMYLTYDYEVGTRLRPEIDDTLDLYDVKRLVNAFMKAGLPKTLRNATLMEEIKLAVMTDEISIDQDGQLAVNWYNGELFIEVVEIYEGNVEDLIRDEDAEDDVDMYEVKKVLARWEVLAKGTEDEFFPPWEMDRNHAKNKEELQRKQDEEIITPFLDDERLREWVAALMNASNANLNIEAQHFKLFGVLHESGQVTARVCLQEGAPYAGDQVILFNRCENFEDLTTVGQPAKLGEVRWFFETHHSTQALEDFNTWFKSKNS